MVNPITGAETDNKCSAMNYYAYRIMIREHNTNHILQCRQLFHQYIVDMYAKIESERLQYIRFNQSKLRSEEYIHLRDAAKHDGHTKQIGKLTILPSSYTGSPRHMHSYAQDAITYVRQYGRPDLFITFTCNPSWDSIQQLLLPDQTSVDRHDITARVFRQKLKSMMAFMVKYEVFGKVRCWMYSVEWQKRGLPHAHILIWLYQKITSNEIDKVISAEIPDPNVDQELHDIVTKNMIHGPCGVLNPKSPCMKDGTCTKRYPRTLIPNTITGNDGYPLYRRRSPEQGGHVTTMRMHKEEIQVDNRWIVPYSPLLSKTYKAHINVEYCNSVKSIKYICKYINKGSDMAVFAMEPKDTSETIDIDEISQYQAGRYISSNEAIWRILMFPIHERSPPVVHLAVHLENGQRVYFTEATLQQVAENPPPTTLTSFFTLCQTDPFARTLLYSEVPTYYTWDPTRKNFARRKRGEPVEGQTGVFKDNTIGRLYTVHPRQDECFFLRLLLVNVRGPTSFQQLKTVNGITYDTFRGACQALNLLENDQHWDECINDACQTSHPKQIRTLFVIILTSCSPSSPTQLWEKYKSYMAEDIFHLIHRQNTEIDDEKSKQIYNEVLIRIEDACLQVAHKLLEQLGMPTPNRTSPPTFEVEMQQELNYNTEEQRTYVQSNIPKLTHEQVSVYNRIINTVENENGEIFFLDAPGGTGKTFLIRLILATIRSENNIALALASSGIAATLLPGGRTAHSALKLPLNIQHIETPICNISKTSSMGKVLQKSKIIIWDECTMAHKKSLEALHRTLQDLRGNKGPFGNATILLAGDFRQTLPIIPRSTPADEINACLKYSDLWQYVKTLKLTTNMRVQLQQDCTADIFTNQLLDIGNGQLPIDQTTGRITLPPNFCTILTSKEQLIQKVFPNIQNNYTNENWLSERAILAPKNVDVYAINHTILSTIPNEILVYKSIDTVVEADEAIHYPTEFLNSLDLPGLPPHILKLKLGVPIIMLRNINPPKLCNGTRLAVKNLLKNVIKARIITGPFKGEDVLIPRIPMIPTDMPFQFSRLQFPIRLAFAMTINKAQGQTLQVCGINLDTECFSHGQLYVACSRVGKPQNLYINAQNGTTKNIVYPQALGQNI
ncbi:uncharacterized protein LOC107983828 [Anolis carolinensis]|uniref:uncharacterized protein LOC107983828 n=1 Tax=Anolis carolinensis TaxID=28377 RepID=UPI002F2B7E0F